MPHTKWRNAAAIILFLLFALPAIGLLNAPAPLAFDTLPDWAAANIAWKDWIVTANTKLNEVLFRVTGEDQVVVGRDGFLFFDETIDSYFGRNASDASVEPIAATLENLSNELAARGIKFTLLIAPNKNSVYPEFMPFNFLKGGEWQAARNLTDSLVSRGVDVANVRPILIANKGDALLYHKTDTHWNDLGARLVYVELMRHAPRDASFDAYDDANLSLAGFAGDLAAIVRPASSVTEPAPTLSLPREFEELTRVRSLMDASIETRSARNDLSAVVVRDSFGSALFPFLANNVGELKYFRAISSKNNYFFGVDWLVLEVAERRLGEIQTLSSEILESLDTP